MHKFLPETEILTVSALDEICRCLGEDRPFRHLKNILEEQFDEFRKLLDQLIASKKETVILDRMQRMTSAMFGEIHEEIERIE